MDKVVKVLLYEIKGFFENSLDFILKEDEKINYNNAQIGKRVLVKVGNILTFGIIIDINFLNSDYGNKYQLKPILKVIDENIYFSKDFLSFLLYFNKNLDYSNTHTKLVLDIIYKYFKEDINYLYKLNNNYKEIINEKYFELLEYLNFEKEKKLKSSYLEKNKKLINNLVKENIIFKNISIKDSLNLKFSYPTYEKKDLIDLEKKDVNEINFDKLIINNINKNNDISFYQNLINKYKNQNKKIVFVFNNNFEINNFKKIILEKLLKDEEIIIFNSYNLTTKTKFKKAFLDINSKNFKVILCFTNSLFYDFKNLGLIYLYNYNENYNDTIVKNEINLFYFLKLKKKLLNIDIYFETIAPNIYLYSKFKNSNIVYLYDVLSYKNDLKIINMFENLTISDFEFIPKDLIDLINNKARINKKTLILFNELNYSKKVSCSNCKYIYKCDNCNINLSYTKEKNQLFCRYCNDKMFFRQNCIKCDNKALIYSNIGIENIYEQIKKIFSNLKIKTYSYEFNKLLDIEKEFLNSIHDIYLMDFKVLNLTKLENIDTILFLNIDNFFDKYDYKQNEKIYLDIIKAISISKDNCQIFILNLYKNLYLDSILKKDFELFILYEKNLRKELNLPPAIFGYTIYISTNKLLKGYKKIYNIFLKLKEKIELVQRPFETLDYITNKTIYTFKILIKSKTDIYKELKLFLNNLNEYEKEYLFNIRLIGDYKK